MAADDREVEGAAYYRQVALRLRRIAEETQFDYRRAAQLRALADGFERLAARIERQTISGC